MSKIIPYGRQHITEEDIQAVTEALLSDYLTQGPKIEEFEQKYAAYIGSKYAVAVTNGTAALHLATMALGLKADEYVICTPITFAASANCVLYVGANVLFADIDPETYLMDLASVRKIIEANPDKKIKGIIPVDFAGRVPQLDAFRKLADEYSLWIIEDACHAPGGYFISTEGNKENAGNGNFADLSVFSFHPVKHIATGEGGMITTNDQLLYNRLMKFRTHGIVKNEQLYVNSIEFAGGIGQYPGWYMEMQDLGYNYRITDFQAALGISQLKRADSGLERRKVIAGNYHRAFEGKPFVKGQSGIVEGHAYHLYILETAQRLDLYNHLRKNNIFAQIHYIPVHLMPYYRQFGWKEGDFPHAENYYKHCISLPMYPTLTDEEQIHVITIINSFFHG